MRSVLHEYIRALREEIKNSAKLDEVKHVFQSIGERLQMKFSAFIRKKLTQSYRAQPHTHFEDTYHSTPLYIILDYEVYNVNSTQTAEQFNMLLYDIEKEIAAIPEHISIYPNDIRSIYYYHQSYNVSWETFKRIEKLANTWEELRILMRQFHEK